MRLQGLSRGFDGIPIAVPDGESVTLYFDLIGADGDSGSAVRVDDVRVTTRAEDGFIRGNANLDDALDITDPIVILNYLLLGTSELNCLDAADVDDDGRVNITDPIYLLGYLFLGSPPPPPPFPTCGPDEGEEDGLGCEPHRYAFARNNPLLHTDPTGNSVAIEYACLAVQALYFGLGFQENIAKPVEALYLNIAEALATLTPPEGDGGVGGVGNGLAGYLAGFAPIPTAPKDVIDPGKNLGAALFCSEAGASGDAARAQGRAAGSGTGGSWTGPSWTKY